MSKDVDNEQFAFCALAIKLGLLGRSEVEAIVEAWSEGSQLPARRFCVEHNYLTDQECELLEAAVARILERHDEDPIAAFQASANGLGEDSLRTLAKHGPASWAGMLERIAGNSELQNSTRTLGCNSSDGGRFDILRPLARGGLGELFVAHDSELHREIALKMIQQWHADDPESRARFLLEAEVTGRLEHPGIVPVHGLGFDHKNRPFYAMRLVQGSSLRDIVEKSHSNDRGNEHAVAFRSLIRRFLQVCETVAYAHSRGVLHRDIKPSNIIFGKYGETLLVDWGLAKIIGTRERHASDEGTIKPSSGSSQSQTQMGRVIGTPAYMSPEQARGQLDDLDGRADVYSLGATLYCLLTGQPPFSKSSGNILQQVQNGNFVSPIQLRPDLPRSIVAICTMAMATSPDQRYQTATALAEELERWLADEPVLACPDTLTDKAGRFYRRNKKLCHFAGGALLAATVASLLAVSVITNTNQALRASNQLVIRQRDEATHSFEDARELATELLAIEERELAKIPGMVGKRLGIAERVTSTMKSFYERYPDDPDVQYSYARALRISSTLNRMVVRTDVAERGYALALELFQKVSTADGRMQAKDELALTLVDFASLQEQLGDLSGAAESLERSMTLAQQLIERDEGNAGYRRTLAYGQLGYASCLWEIGRVEDAVSATDRAAEGFQSLIGTPDEGSLDVAMLLSTVEIQLKALLDTKSIGEAGKLADGAVTIATARAEADASNDNVNLLARILHLRAQTRLSSDPATPAGLDDLALAIQKLEQLVDEYEAFSIYRSYLAECLLTSAEFALERGELPHADSAIESALEHIEASLEASNSPHAKAAMVDALEQRSRLYGRRKQWMQAASDVQRAVELQEEIAARSPESNRQLRRLGTLKSLWDDYRRQLNRE